MDPETHKIEHAESYRTLSHGKIQHCSQLHEEGAPRLLLI
jgi:hypothetical protein